MNEYQWSLLKQTRVFVEKYERDLKYFQGSDCKITPDYTEEQRQKTIAYISDGLTRFRVELFFLENYPNHPITLAFVDASGEALITHIEYCWQEDGEEENKANQKLHEAYEALVALKATLR